MELAGLVGEEEHRAAVLADLDSIVLPGITHWQSPNFFGFFPANTSGPSIPGNVTENLAPIQR